MKIKTSELTGPALQSQVKKDTTLFCDLKTDEEKSAFFLSGRGYETGVIAQSIQNDVAMAYHRCAEYKKELEALQSQDREDAQPKLKVVVCSFPESNGKRNWTALLLREQPWEGLAGNCGGITLAYGELWNRVAYEAECTKFLLGMRDTEPCILDYGVDIETPEQWLGEAIDHARRIEGGGE